MTRLGGKAKGAGSPCRSGDETDIVSKAGASKAPGTPSSSFMLLEPRIVFDAAAPATATLQATAEPKAVAAAEPGAIAADAAPAADGGTSLALFGDVAAPVIGSAGMLAARHEVVFVDGHAADYDGLLAASALGGEVIVLDVGRDGLQQLRDALAARTGVDTIRILADGTADALRLGTAQLDLGNLHALRAELGQAGHALSSDGELLIYGAGTGTGQEILRLVQSDLLSPATSGALAIANAEVLASDAERTHVADALTRAEQTIGELLLRDDAVDALGTLFAPGAMETEAWRASAQAFVEAYRAGQLTLGIELRTQGELLGAYAAFAAEGPHGRPLVYVDAGWATRASSDSLTRALLEEFGHFADWHLNGGVDSAGDEGERFAAVLMGQSLDVDQWQRIATENDHLVLNLDGHEVTVEMASLMFNWAYSTATTYNLEANQPVMGTALAGTGVIYPDVAPSNASTPTTSTTGLDDDRVKPLPQTDFRIEQITRGGTYGDPSELPPYAWPLIPLGPPPAFVTGTLLAAQQGNAEGFATTSTAVPALSGALNSPTGLFSPLQDLSALTREPMPQERGQLIEIGVTPPRPDAVLFVQREPGRGVVRNAEETQLALPRGLFGHQNRNATITVEARRGDGSPLPAWLSFDVANGRIVANPPSNVAGAFEIQIIARDAAGNEATTTYTLIVRDRGERADATDTSTVASQAWDAVSVAADAQDILALFVAPDAGRLAPSYTDLAQFREGFTHMLALAALERSGAAVLPTNADANR